jgi:transposase
MNTNEKPYTTQVVKAIMTFLRLFMCETLVKRIMSMMLLATGFHKNRITELTGMCDKSVRTLKKALELGEIDGLFHVGGGGQKRKLADVETSIIKEVTENEYHSQQQIADMVHEKFGIKVSAITIGRLLKKTT